MIQGKANRIPGGPKSLSKFLELKETLSICFAINKSCVQVARKMDTSELQNFLSNTYPLFSTVPYTDITYEKYINNLSTATPCRFQTVT